MFCFFFIPAICLNLGEVIGKSYVVAWEDRSIPRTRIFRHDINMRHRWILTDAMNSEEQAYELAKR